MNNLDQFFQDNDRGYPRDPRRLAYKKLQKNIQGMDREQLEAFIKANLFIPHSQYKMALGNLIQFLKKQDQMNQLNEVKRFQKIAGLLKEGPFSESNIFLPDSYLAELDQLVDAANLQHGSNPYLRGTLNQFIHVLEVGWRLYDDTFDGEFDGDAANMDIEDVETLYDGQKVSYTSAKEELDEIVPGLSEEIEDLFMEGKQEYYESVNEWHPDDPSAVDTDDIEDQDPDDFDDISEEERDDDVAHYETVQDFLDVVFDIVNDEMRAGYFSAKGLNKVDAYLTKHGEALFRSGKSAEDVAEALMAKFNYTVSEDADYESQTGDTNAMGDTDAMNINEDDEYANIPNTVEGWVNYLYTEADPKQKAKLASIYREQMDFEEAIDARDFFLDLIDSSDPEAIIPLEDLDQYSGY